MANQNFEETYEVNETIFTAQENNKSKQIRTIFDPVHDHILLPAILWKIIDTEQFQRLRNIKYNEFLYGVYMGATFSFFDLSIGAAHLAKMYMLFIEETNSNNELFSKFIDGNSKDHFKDIICLTQVAALSYNLGQLPFRKIIKKLLKNQNYEICPKNDRSVQLLEIILLNQQLSNNQLSENKAEKTFNDEQVEVIKYMILGISQDEWGKKDNEFKKKYPYWIFKIVKNQDKSDKGKYNFDIIRLEKQFRVNFAILGKPINKEYYYIFIHTQIYTPKNQKDPQICDLKLNQIKNFEDEKKHHDKILKYHKANMGISLTFYDVFESVFDFLTSHISFFQKEAYKNYQNHHDKKKYLLDKKEQIREFNYLDDNIIDEIKKNRSKNEMFKAGQQIIQQYENRIFLKLMFDGYFEFNQEVEQFIQYVEQSFQNTKLKIIILLENQDQSQKQVFIEDLNFKNGQKGDKILIRIYSDKEIKAHFKDIKEKFKDRKEPITTQEQQSSSKQPSQCSLEKIDEKEEKQLKKNQQPQNDNENSFSQIS
ncbi:transmembrane protein, putative (macronuclear) [Tetrahymena thermophila SB210]|uniref:Transmembrane protein, putative n=1 Tax=Tetrahymena thermophila (strain SB210) TaxID=312017 RepID=Q23DK7_TETTS|nr:transmembrane protein, putative [Tetrahymena thermophila SB210]EAR94659.1 transmembrane protein, putative [Tetrahymena thermophila SB210]|eukprot:XP_001014679.1 transmembrane protein, putative [Tetrahymena thermophila SB210]